jgi:hypothetical protein
MPRPEAQSAAPRRRLDDGNNLSRLTSLTNSLFTGVATKF